MNKPKVDNDYHVKDYRLRRDMKHYDAWVFALGFIVGAGFGASLMVLIQ